MFFLCYSAPCGWRTKRDWRQTGCVEGEIYSFCLNHKLIVDIKYICRKTLQVKSNEASKTCQGILVSKQKLDQTATTKGSAGH